MGRLTCWTSLVLLVVFLCHLQTSAACSCRYKHPQTKFCESHFVALLTVEEFATVNETDYFVAYKVNVSQIFKATPAAQIAMEQKPLWLWTPSQSSLCGLLAPKPGETWIVGGEMYGGQPYLSYCGLAMLWSDVTPIQRDNFREFYRHGCVCQISDPSSVSAANETCIRRNSPEEKGCQERYGICMPGSAGCSWTLSIDYYTCMMKYRLGKQH